MSSLIEKILMIGFGATICLSLFSLITPLIDHLQFDDGNSNYNSDVLNFYQLITEIKRNGKIAIHFPGQEFSIENHFSKANSIQFFKPNNLTLNIELELENKLFVGIIEFEVKITIRLVNNPEELQYYRISSPNEGERSINLMFRLFQMNNSLWFEFTS